MKILSRKILASILVFIMATIFLLLNKIAGMDWVELAVITIMGYIAGDGVGTILTYIRVSKIPSGETPVEPVVRNRIENLWDIKFLGAIFIFVVGTALFMYGKLGMLEWKYVAMGMIVGYNLLNPIDKLYR